MKLRAKLVENWARIETLKVGFVFQTDRPDILAGRNEILYSRGRYHIQHFGKDMSLVRIIERERMLDAVLRAGVVERATIHNRSAGSRGMMLKTFLPVPDDRPSLVHGARNILGDSCLALQQDRFRYWITSSFARVRAVDVFRTSEAVRQTVIFDNFSSLSPDLEFPQSVKVQTFDRTGFAVSHSSLQVSEVALNLPLAESLFSIDFFLETTPRK